MAIRQRHAFLAPPLSDAYLDKFEFGKDGVKVSDWDSPLHSRITVPVAQLSHPFQIAWSKGNFNRDIPFPVVEEGGLRVDTPPEASWASMEAVVRKVLGPTSFNQSAVVETDNWKSFVDHDFDMSLDGSGLIGEYINPEYLKYANSVFVTHGVVPSHPTKMQSPSDLVIEVYWESRAQLAEELGISTMELPGGSGKMELGLLHYDKLVGEDEFRVKGLLRKLGAKDYEKTMFFVSPKHRRSDVVFSADFHKPIGLHPRHEIAFSEVPQAPLPENCKLYAKYNIPKSLFLDKYQLADLDRTTTATAASGKLIALWGETDLEAPVWTVPGWGSEAVIEIYPKSSQFEVPMHSRYEIPQESDSHVYHDMPYPNIFWACKNPDPKQDSEYPRLGYDSLFPQDTVFFHLKPNGTISEYSIPVAPLARYVSVQEGTVTVILAGFLWLLVKVLLNIWKRK
ncbi:hypothetical protein TRVA0_001S05160 [Trichomonascus vanleenenianus]|uniref:Pbn1p n=1 Tax=Trichomonascus vanleenenianus TaxID=2268995 RepID=UPI003ECA3D9A